MWLKFNETKILLCIIMYNLIITSLRYYECIIAFSPQSNDMFYTIEEIRAILLEKILNLNVNLF